MIKIESSFMLFEPRARYPWVQRVEPSSTEPRVKELLLKGTLISLEVAGRTLDLSTSTAPSDDGFRSSGFGWIRKVVPLAPGMVLEQQTLLASNGSTVALSWRLSGHELTPVHLTAIPVFSAQNAPSNKLFRFDSETNGGRLTWRPYERHAGIVADTNGRFSVPSPAIASPVASDRAHIAIPAAFDFDLGRHPAILIFSVESEEKSSVDPLIGGFLAELVNPRAQARAGDYLLALAAA